MTSVGPMLLSDFTEDELSFGERAVPDRRPGDEPAAPNRFQGTDRFRDPVLIGQGGMGLVYRVRDLETDQDIALKVLRRFDSDELYRLKQEFRILAGILHPNLVHLYELFAAPSDCFLTMELLEGVDFLSWVRGDAALDRQPAQNRPGLAPQRQQRLRAALRQLVAGLSAVHAANRLHRDIKPSNVMVTHQGAVKILDFGLTTSLAVQRNPGIAGTPVYMAPEQALGGELSTASDWYSVGVMLYEAMTGYRPHADDLSRLLFRQYERPPSPHSIDPSLDAGLSDLAMALLSPDPLARPQVAEIQARLDGHAAVRIEVREPSQVGFVGREAELAQLHQAWRRVQAKHPSIVRLHGPSGMGKSELTRRFLGDLEGQGALVLSGRCLAQESVPYKALDAVVDALRHALGRKNVAESVSWRPVHAAPLLRVFPVLKAVPGLNDSDADAAQDALEPHELRRRAFLGLRQLLSHVAQSQPVAIAIDDLQWSDLDSIQLLRELLRAPDPPGLLLLLTWRSEPGPQSEVLQRLRHDAEELPPTWQTEIELGPLQPDLAEQLAATLLGPRHTSEAAAEVARESLGSPYFCGELARHRAAGGATVSLADVVGARIGTLTAPARTLLEVVAVAGRPIDQALALQSAGLGEAGRPLVAHLQQACLVLTSPRGDRTAVEPYHDRVREAIIASLSAATLRDRHRTLADALGRRPDADPEDLFTHHAGAGDVDQTCHFALLAADRAAAALAFTRAAALYQMTLDLLLLQHAVSPGVEEHTLRVRLAGVLTQAGRGAEAGAQLQRAADLVALKRPDSTEVLTLRRRAAEQFLHSGRLLEGKAILASVLSEMGIGLPATPIRAMATATWYRLRLWKRGLKFRPRPASQQDAGALDRLDALWGAATSMALVHHTIADALGVRHLLHALDLGEPSRLARALGFEAAFEAVFPIGFFQRNSRRLLAMVAQLAEQTGNDYDRAWHMMTLGGAAWFEARWREVVSANDAAEALYRARCQGVEWEVAIMHFYTLSALANLGELKELNSRIDQVLDEALARGDLFAANHTRLGQACLGWLAQDRLEHARLQAAEALASVPSGQFHMQHYYHLVSATSADLYAGDGTAAWQRMTQAWSGLKGAQFLMVQYVRSELQHLRGRAALAALEAVSHGAPDLEARALLRDLDVRIRSVASHTARYAPYADLLRAGREVQKGNPRAALPHLAAAREGFARLDMALYRESARLAEGVLAGDDRAREMAIAWMENEGVVRPYKLAAALVPGCGLARLEP